jgi:type IV pilus assembly protein PilW
MAMILKNVNERRNQQQGFTLVELMVAMAILGIVMGAIYSTYKSQQDSYVAQEQVVEMQQNLRASLYKLAKDLRAAGYNPAKNPNIEGFRTEIPEEEGEASPETSTSATSLAITADLDMNEQINADDDIEQIAYRFNNGNLTLEKFMYDAATTSWNWQTVADNIDAVNFVYLDGDENPIDPATATNLPLIRSVQVTIVARTGRGDRNFSGTPAYVNKQGVQILEAKSDNYRRRLLTTTIFCRNMGI